MNDDLIFRALTNRASGEEQAAVGAWRDQSDENERRYRELERLLKFVTAVQAKRNPRSPPSVGEVLNRDDDHPGTVDHRWGDVPGAAARRFRWSKGFRWSAAAAVLILFSAGVIGFPFQQSTSVALGAEEFVTGSDGKATVTLDDGTVVRLGDRSRLVVPPDVDGREVSISGNAFFAVAHDKNRPFKIRTDAGQVDVLGTRFALETSGEDLDVIVVEGEVALTSRGQRMAVGAQERGRVINGAAPLPPVSVPEAQTAPEWVGVFLAFQETPLSSAVREIEKVYEVRIEIVDPALTNRTVTASFTEWSMEDVIEAVCTVVRAQCETRNSVTTMRSSD